MSAANVSSRFEGDLYERGAAGYEEARSAAVWNGRKPARFPDQILVAASTQDVVQGVRLARDQDLKVGIRSGGHSVAATGIRDGGLLIDLSQLTDIDVDATEKTAWIGPGVLGNQLGRRLDEDGLAFPYGGSPSVGMGGFLVSGGYGLNGKTYGSAASNIIAIDVVTAAGELIRADERNHTDYLWAARGGGYGFFGVVVRFQLQLYDAPQYLTKTTYTFAMDVFDEFATWFFRHLHELDTRLMTLVLGVRSPQTGEIVVRIIALGFADSEADARELIRPLAEAPFISQALASEDTALTTLEEVWAGVDLLYPKGARYITDTAWIENPSDPNFVAALRPAFESIPTRGSHVMMNPWVPEDLAGAVLSGTTRLPVHLYGVGDEPSDDSPIRDWIAESMRLIVPFSNGVGKINESDLLVRDQHVLAPANEARLEKLRAELDPRGRFYSFLRPQASRDAG